MPEWIMRPLPWYVAGPLIGLIVPALLLIGNKAFGISSTLRHICAACMPANISFFKYNWKKENKTFQLTHHHDLLYQIIRCAPSHVIANLP